LNDNFGTDYTKDDIAIYDPPEILRTIENQNIVAIQFTKVYDPEFFYIKVGHGQTGFSHYLFENFEETGWGVIDLNAIMNINSAGDFNAVQIEDIISHVGSIGGTTPVPEPGTIVLLGAGLIGLAFYGRKSGRK